MATLLKEYTNMDNEYAVPAGKQEIILMLLNGVVQKIEAAKDAHARGDLSEKGFHLGRATGIVDALRNMLDTRSGDQLSTDLDTVYNHVDLLLQAGLDPTCLHYLDEAAEILENLAIGCNFVAPEARPVSAEAMHA